MKLAFALGEKGLYERQESTSSFEFVVMQEWLSDSNNWIDPRVLWHFLARMCWEVNCIPARMFGGKTKTFESFLKDAGLVKEDSKPAEPKKFENLTPEEEKHQRDLATVAAMHRYGIPIPPELQGLE